MTEEIRNVIIIGSGPAGLTAGLYLSRANLKPLLVAGSKWGGQLMLTTEVENYPGFVEGILGPKLMENFRHQAERFGAEIVNEDVTDVELKVRPFKVTSGGKTYQAKSVIIATGAETNWLGLENEQKLIGRGVSSCAPCDAFFFKDKKVIVVGGGDSAKKNAKIKWITNSTVVDVMGADKVEGVKIKNVKDKSERELAVDGMFVAIGHHPMTDIFKGQVELDEKGFVKLAPKGEGPGAFQMMTSVEGVFVAGDVHDYHFRQAVTAAGYGCAAGLGAGRGVEGE